MRRSALTKFSLALALVALTLFPRPVPAQEGDPWSLFRFLIGNWSGTWSGEPGTSISGSVSFSYDLDRKVIIRRTKVEFPPQPGESTGVHHEDLLIIYRQPGTNRPQAIYFDREGVVVNYTFCSASDAPSIMFQTDRAAPGPWFRMVFKMTQDGPLSLDFLIAPPGGALKSHVKGLVRREP